MPEEDQKDSIKLRGKGKILAGIVMTFFPPAGRFVGLISMGVGATVGILGGVGGKIISWCCSDPENRAYWQEKSQQARSWGTKAFLGGLFFVASPVIAGIAMIGEGAYNQTGENKYGLVPILRPVAKFISGGLPQPGDPVLSQEINSLSQQSNTQHLSMNQFQPVKSISNMASVINSPNFEQAQNAYRNEIRNVSEDQKYVMGKSEACGNGNYSAIFVPFEYKGRESECPKEFQVEQIFNKDMQVIKINPGNKATCVFPPIKTDSGFEVQKCENGNSIDCKASANSVQNMQKHLGNGTSNSSPPPGKVSEQFQGR